MHAPIAIAMMLAGCAASTTSVADAGTDARANDAGLDVMSPDTHCDLLPEPRATPTLMAGFAENDPAHGFAPPMMTGGDPIGMWVFDHGTFWIDTTANTMFNRFASSVSGTAWIAITATEFRLDYDLTITLAQTAAGTIVQHNLTRVRARWRLDREQIEPIGLVCGESNPSPVGDPGRVTFTRRDATHLTLTTEVPQPTGTTIIVLEGTLAP